jgi:predicted transposase YdaD
VKKVVIYKFPYKSRQELEAMFGLSEWKQTRFYQDVREETKLEAVPRLLKLGLTVEQIAEALELNIETARQAAEDQSSH